MTNVSRAGAGMYASLLVLILQLIGIDMDEGMATEVVLALSQLVAAGVWVYGQISRKDLSFGLVRK